MINILSIRFTGISPYFIFYARAKAPGSEPGFVGIRAFESHLSH